MVFGRHLCYFEEVPIALCWIFILVFLLFSFFFFFYFPKCNSLVAMDLEETCSQEHLRCWQISEEANGPAGALPGSAESTGFEQSYGQGLLQYPCAQDVDHELVLLAFCEILGIAKCSFPQNINQLCKSSVLLVQHILIVCPYIHSLRGIVQYIKECRCCCCFLPHFSGKMTGAWNYYSMFCLFCH